MVGHPHTDHEDSVRRLSERVSELTGANHQLQEEIAQLRSKRHQLEAKAKEIQRLSTIVENCQDAILTLNSTGEILSWNEAAEKVFDYRAREVLGRHFGLLSRAERLDERASLRKFEPEQKVTRFDSVWLRKDGIPVDVSLTVSPLADARGKPFGFSLIVRDVTEEKRAQRALLGYEDKLRSVLENVPACICLVDREGRILFTNRAIDGIPIAEVIGMPIYRLLIPEAKIIVRDAMHAVFLTGQVQKYEIPWRGRNERDAWYACRLAPIRRGEQVVSAICVAIDITDRVAAQQQLRQKESELIHMSRLSILGEMVAGIAHEINQPLGAVAAFADACTNTLQGMDDQRARNVMEWTQQIARQAVRCGRFIAKMRDLGKNDEADRTVVDLNDVVRESIALLGAVDVQRSAVLEADLADPGPAVWANQNELQQVVFNLLRNAHEAIEDGQQNGDRITIRSFSDEGHAFLVIEDEGPGISSEQIDKLFDPFFSTKRDGMGMGLAICRTIVQGHGGRIWAEPNLASGAKFFVELPMMGHDQY